MGSFSKKISQVRIFIETFCSIESDVLAMEQTKSRNHCQLPTTIRTYWQITYLLQKFFRQQNVKNELFSTTCKFPNVNRNATLW